MTIVFNFNLLVGLSISLANTDNRVFQQRSSNKHQKTIRMVSKQNSRSVVKFWISQQPAVTQVQNLNRRLFWTDNQIRFCFGAVDCERNFRSPAMGHRNIFRVVSNHIYVLYFMYTIFLSRFLTINNPFI